jgi:hypothetical protein
MFGIDIGRLVAYGIAAAAVVGAAWLHGYSRGELKLFEYQAEQAEARVVIIKKIERVRDVVREVHVKREVQIQKVFIEIEKESAHVPSRAACNATYGWLFGHNAAAAAGSPEGRLDDAADTGVTEARTLAVVQANYKAFHVVANDLRACRAYVTGLAEAAK